MLGNEDKLRPAALEKMIHLVALLVDYARHPDNPEAGFALSEADLSALCGSSIGAANSAASSTASSPRSGASGEDTKPPPPTQFPFKAHTPNPSSIQLSKQTRFPFLFQQIKDNLNLKATVTVIVALAKWKESLAEPIVQMLFKG